MEGIYLKEVVLETLNGLTNQTIAEQLNVSHKTASRVKKGSPAQVDFFKTIEFIELVLEKNGLVITNKIN